MNRKFKDLSRSRGIISYYHHPLKDIYFKAAAGLMTCLKAFDFFHTNLFSPLQALPMIKFLFLYLHNRFGSETTFHSWAADVKEMHDCFLNQTYCKQLNGHYHTYLRRLEERMLLSSLSVQN